MEVIKKYGLLSLILYTCFFSPAQVRTPGYYISAAISNNALLNDYHNQLLLNTIDSQLLVASAKIQITGNGNSYYAPVIKGYGYDEVITNGAQLQALATATKKLLPKKYLALQYNELQITGDSLRIASRISERELTRSVLTQYITVFADQLQIEFNTELLKILNREEMVLMQLTQKNVYKQVDYLAFLVTLKQQELVHQQLQLQFKNDLGTLNYLAGIFDTGVVRLNLPDTVIRENLINEELPFFLRFRTDSLRLINNRSLIALNYRPQVNLFADGGYQSSLMLRPYKNFGTSVGLNFILPIYDGRQRKMQYLKLSIAERTRVKNKEFFENQYHQQVMILQEQIAGIINLTGAINTQIKYIEALVEANGKLLKTGDIRMTDYVLAINTLITAKNLVVQNKISRYQVINELNYWRR